MSWKKLVSDAAEFFTGEAIRGAAKKAQDTIENTTRRVIKASALFMLFFIGALFMLIGLASYVQDAFRLADGMGLVIVGLVLLLLGFFAKAMK